MRLPVAHIKTKTNKQTNKKTDRNKLSKGYVMFIMLRGVIYRSKNSISPIDIINYKNYGSVTVTVMYVNI